MKNKLLLILSILACLAAALGLSACVVDDTTYLYIRYDANKGAYGADPSRRIYDRYDYEASMTDAGLPLVDPESDLRGDGGLKTIGRTGFIFLGWFRERIPRTDADGNMLDDYGNVTEDESTQGYTFAGKWDFSSDRVMREDLKPDEDGNYEFTLYAAWSPQYTYSFYREMTDEELAAQRKEYEDAQAARKQALIADGQPINEEDFPPFVEERWQVYGTYASDTPPELAIPGRSSKTGGIDYGNVPVYNDHTLTGIYPNASLNEAEKYTASIPHPGIIHAEEGYGEGMVIALYTDWMDGTWYHIDDASQLATLDADGCYEIEADLNFEGKTWNGSRTIFTGLFHGNGHTLSGIESKQNDQTTTCSGGVFGTIDASAEVTNVKFAGVSFHLAQVCTRAGCTYGLFAGAIEPEAKVEGVTVDGTLYLGVLTNLYEERGDYSFMTVSLVAGNGENKDISYAASKVEVERVVVGYEDITYAEVWGWFVRATVGEEGVVEISLNPDKTQDPNP